MSLFNFLLSPRTGGIRGLLEELFFKLLPLETPEYVGWWPGAYSDAVFESRKDFVDRVVVDVDDGTGLLWFTAVGTGARHVYTVGAHDEAEAETVRVLGYAERITVINGKMEEIELPEKADILISRPMGTLIFHHEGLKDYVIARDRFLKPNGKMFPSLGRIHMAPITDERLFNGDADKPVVEAYMPEVLVASETSHIIDFNAIKEEDVSNINIPLKFTASVGATIHGLAWWFDVLFNGSTIQMWLPTSHGEHTGYWQQLRCILSKPIHVKPGQEITGRLRLVAQRGMNYTIYLTMSAEQDGHLQTSSVKLDLDEVYYAVPIPKFYTVEEATAYLVETEDVPTMQGRNGSLQQPSDMRPRRGYRKKGSNSLKRSNSI